MKVSKTKEHDHEGFKKQLPALKAAFEKLREGKTVSVIIIGNSYPADDTAAAEGFGIIHKDNQKHIFKL